MKTTIFTILITSLASLTWGQYSNGSFLSINDFSAAETLIHKKSPNSLYGSWTGDGNYDMRFHEVGNIYLAVISSINTSRPKFQLNEVAAVISYQTDDRYRFAIRDKRQDGNEYILKRTYALVNQRLIDTEGGHVLSKVDPSMDSQLASSMSGTLNNKTSVKNKVPGSKKPPRASSSRREALLAARSANREKYTQSKPAKSMPPPTKNNKDQFKNVPTAINQSKIHNTNQPTAHQNSETTKNRFFAQQGDKRKKKKRKKGLFGKIIKGAGQLVMGAASAYAGTMGALSSIGSDVLPGKNADLSKVASALGEALKNSKNNTGTTSTNNQKDILDKINSLMAKDNNTQDEVLVSTLSELLKKAEDNSSDESENQLDQYTKKQIDNFQKNYGDLLEKMGINF